MTLTITPYDFFPCGIETFIINCIDADVDDFGNRSINGDCMENQCCCSFEYKLPTQEILDKYNINLSEYAEVCERLRELLNFNYCGLCS